MLGIWQLGFGNYVRASSGSVSMITNECYSTTYSCQIKYLIRVVLSRLFISFLIFLLAQVFFFPKRKSVVKSVVKIKIKRGNFPPHNLFSFFLLAQVFFFPKRKSVLAARTQRRVRFRTDEIPCSTVHRSEIVERRGRHWIIHLEALRNGVPPRYIPVVAFYWR